MERKADYTRADLARAFAAVGLKEGDVVFSHSNVGYFGRPEGGLNAANVFEVVYGAFHDVIGDSGTLVVPTFTYSFSQNKVFDPDNTPGDCGIFTELVRQHPDAVRSEDPNVSVAAIGAKANELVFELPGNTYDNDGFFGRFHRANGVICNLNFDAGSTFLHYVERCLEVPYRYDKSFHGIFSRNGVEEEREATIWVRNLASEDTCAVFEPFDSFARERGLYREATVGRGAVGMITAADSYNLLRDLLPDYPWVLTRAHVSGNYPAL